MVFLVDATLLLWGKIAKNLTKTFLFTAMSRTRESTKQAYIEKTPFGDHRARMMKENFKPSNTVICPPHFKDEEIKSQRGQVTQKSLHWATCSICSEPRSLVSPRADSLATFLTSFLWLAVWTFFFSFFFSFFKFYLQKFLFRCYLKEYSDLFIYHLCMLISLRNKIEEWRKQGI